MTVFEIGYSCRLPAWPY